MKITTKLKRKKAQDRMGWKNEFILEGGEEMVKSLQKLFNRMSEENIIPKEWENMDIETIYKNKGSRIEVTNRRGLFFNKYSEQSLRKSNHDKDRRNNYDINIPKWRENGKIHER